MPCFELFARAADAATAARSSATRQVKVAVEAAVRQGWDAIIGSDGVFVGMTGFGASAPYKDLYKHFGITAEAVAEAALSKLGKRLPDCAASDVMLRVHGSAVQAAHG